jgi:Tfp pilus assembly protein PilF
MKTPIVAASIVTIVYCSFAGAATDPYQPKDISETTYAQVVKAREARIGGNPGIAVTQLEAIVKTNPNYFLAHYNLGLAYNDLKRVDDAILELQQAKQLNEKLGLGEPTVDNSLGSLYLSTRRYQDALVELQLASSPRNAQKLDPKARQVVFNNLGLAFSGLKRTCEAAVAYDLATNASTSPSATATATASELTGSWIVEEWIQHNTAPTLNADTNKVSGSLIIGRPQSDASYRGSLSLCVKERERIASYSVHESMTIQNSGGTIRMDGRVAAGALVWDNDQINVTRSGDSITGTAWSSNTPHDVYKVTFEKLW